MGGCVFINVLVWYALYKMKQTTELVVYLFLYFAVLKGLTFLSVDGVVVCGGDIWEHCITNNNLLWLINECKSWCYQIKLPQKSKWFKLVIEED